MAACAHIDPARAPAIGQKTGALCAAIRVVLAAYQDGRERQLLQRDGRPAGNALGQIGALHITGCYQQGTTHLMRSQGRMRCPPCCQYAAQAVRDQQHGLWRIHHCFLQPGCPIAALGVHPIVLLHTLVAALLFPHGLPMAGAAVLPAR